MKLTQIISGTLSAKGNLSGYNATGDRIHISKQQLTSLFGADKEPSYPFFANVGTKTFNIDPDDESKGTFDRVQALSVFATEEAAIGAINSDAKLALRAKADLASAVKSLNLTAEEVAALESVA